MKIKKKIFISLPVLIPAFLILLSGCKNKAEFREHFEKKTLDLKRWEITQKGNFKESKTDVVDGRLRLGANTLETPSPMKFLGIRSKKKIDFTEKKTISFDLDWNKQSNGCYLSAAVYVCPAKTETNPKDEKNWLKFEYVGVPPGRNVRTNIWARVNGALRQLSTDWGPRNSKGKPLGKPIDNQQIRIVLDSNNLQIFENDKEIYPQSPHRLNFTSGYLYLQMSSGTNYSFREVYFDNVIVSQPF